MTIKQCPLKHFTVKPDVAVHRTMFDICSGKNCAWYIEETNECAITCIATRLERGVVHVQWAKLIKEML
jgi:hypothetical protein